MSPRAGPMRADASKMPERTDGAFAGMDDDGDTEIDEALPVGSEAFDCDGDGFRGSLEDHVYAGTGGRDQDSCGRNGWPANLSSGPSSVNQITLIDVTSFVSIPRRLGTDPGDEGYDVRWDLSRGNGASFPRTSTRRI